MGGDYLHQTIDTHAVCGLGSTDPGCTAARQTKQQTRLLIGRDDIEAIASDKFTATPVEERTMKTAPTLDEMLVADTPANALLSSASPPLCHCTLPPLQRRRPYPLCACLHRVHTQECAPSRQYAGRSDVHNKDIDIPSLRQQLHMTLCYHQQKVQ